MNSENSALASSSMKMSRKLASQMPNPGSPYSFSHFATRSSRGTSKNGRRSGSWMKPPGVRAQMAKISS